MPFFIPQTMRLSTLKGKLKTLFFALLLCCVLSAISYAQPYRNSVAATDFDYIQDADPSTFLCLEYKGEGLREMPDKTQESVLKQPAYIFVAYFEDGTSVDMALTSEFQDEEAARKEALRYAPRLGKLPTLLRQGVKRLVVHKGPENSTGFADVGLIVLYSDNATARISTHDLEETIFHESVHAAWDDSLTIDKQEEWRKAQMSDGVFITDYARDAPNEDLAESALFAYTLLHYPERIPEPDATQIGRAIPARIAFVRELLPPEEPIFYSVGPQYACDGSGETFTVDEN